MIQGGDPNSKSEETMNKAGLGGPGYTVPAEILPGMFHTKGKLCAARQPDRVNPKLESSGSQFYLVQGRTFNEAALAQQEKFAAALANVPEERQTFNNSCRDVLSVGEAMLAGELDYRRGIRSWKPDQVEEPDFEEVRPDPSRELS